MDGLRNSDRFQSGLYRIVLTLPESHPRSSRESHAVLQVVSWWNHWRRTSDVGHRAWTPGSGRGPRIGSICQRRGGHALAFESGSEVDVLLRPANRSGDSPAPVNLNIGGQGEASQITEHSSRDTRAIDRIVGGCIRSSVRRNESHGQGLDC